MEMGGEAFDVLDAGALDEMKWMSERRARSTANSSALKLVARSPSGAEDDQMCRPVGVKHATPAPPPPVWSG